MKTFLSIGAGPGMGLATAERFAREGYRVVLGARSAEKTRSLAKRLEQAGLAVDTATVDAGDPSSVATVISDVEQRYGAIDVLHYNAASLRNATVQDQPAATFNTDLAVNIGGALAAIQAVLPGMAARATGDILLTGGGFALTPSPDYLSISIGKAGIRALALGLFDSLRERGVHVSTVTVAGFVSPGSTDAEQVGEAFWRLHAQPKEAWTVEEVYSPMA
jgi:short-subunit dehydrogenase